MSMTPITKDKRLMVVAGSIVLVLALVAAGRHLNEQELTWLGSVIGLYVAQSQWGQTKRALGTPPTP